MSDRTSHLIWIVVSVRAKRWAWWAILHRLMTKSQWVKRSNRMQTHYFVFLRSFTSYWAFDCINEIPFVITYKYYVSGQTVREYSFAYVNCDRDSEKNKTLRTSMQQPKSTNKRISYRNNSQSPPASSSINAMAAAAATKSNKEK